MSLKLRTHKTEGTLLIIDGNNGSPIMSVILQNGQVSYEGVFGDNYRIISSFSIEHMRGHNIQN